MSDQTDQIVFGLGRLAALLRAGQWQAGAAAGLNPAQVEILTRIAVRPMRPGELAAHLGVSPASLSDSVASLVGKGLAERRPDPRDGRAQQIVPTDQGAARAAALPTAPEPLRTALDHLSEIERAALLRTLMQLIRDLQEARAIPVQRICVTCAYFHPHAHDDAALPHHCAFVSAAFGGADLRLDCGDHEAATPEEATATWRRFATG